MRKVRKIKRANGYLRARRSGRKFFIIFDEVGSKRTQVDIWDECRSEGNIAVTKDDDKQLFREPADIGWLKMSNVKPT